MPAPGGSALGGACSGGACSRGVPAPGGVPALGGACSGGVPARGGVWRPPKADSYCCRRYASYWNAFSLEILLTRGK